LPAWAQRATDPAVRGDEFLLLASLIGHPEKLGEALALVSFTDFQVDAHRRIFRAILSLNVDDNVIDAPGLYQQLKYSGELDDVGVEFLGELAACARETNHPAMYAKRVVEHASGVKLRRLTADLAHRAENPNGPPGQMVAEFEAELEVLKARLSGSKSSRWPAAVPVSELTNSAAEVAFLWNGIIALSHLTLIVALAKCGKTTFLAHLLRALQDGDDFIGRPTEKCRTIYVTEESPALWLERRDAIGLTDSLHVLCRPMHTRPTQLEWVEFVGHIHAQTVQHKCNLVFIDTIGNFAPWKNENDAAEVQAALTPLNRLYAANIAVVAVQHAGKADGRQGTAARGSSALVGAADVVIELRRFNTDDRDDRRRVVTGYGRFDDVPTELVVTLDPDGSGYTAEGDRKAMAARELTAAILKVLPDSPPGMTGDKVHEDLDEEDRPGRGKVGAALVEGAQAGKWQSSGSGKKGDPRQFWRS
jgi:hypothetical protein